jgi:NAD(P)-dependent dehydrogenase (short-subunit alcohol dehydrogenase family)
MSEPLAGKIAVITGSARGLGRAYALRLAELGANIVVADLDLNGAAIYGEKLGQETVMAEVEAMGRESLGVEGDLSHPEMVSHLFKQVLERFGQIDILINNAGGAIARNSGPLPTQTTPDDFELLVNANFRSAVLCCQAVADPMRKRQSGIIVNTSSQTAISTLPQGTLAVYGATKAAVTQYTRALAAELGPHGIRVNALSPGIMMTARVAAQAKERGIGTEEQATSIPLRRLGVAEDCVGVVEFLVTDLSQYVTGQCISVCGGAVLTPC